VRIGVPHPHCAVLTTTDDHWEAGMEAHRRHIVGMAVQSGNARLILIVPDLDELIVSGRDEVGLVLAVIVVNAVHLKSSLLIKLVRKKSMKAYSLPVSL